ncbi:MAG: hypothetical protein UX07_C0008G0022 [Parcubacteria group bacterium GW2011_GWA2_45_30]|nr:MAG: hypothetical protein UX07_C0008G0022 [Parcubacteria group bacterium GW2011_GWA2_45_30]
MNYQKIDAPFAVVLHGASNDDEFDVFIHVAEDFRKKERKFLEDFGVCVELGGRRIFTAKLSRASINKISRQSWVRMICCSSKLKYK